MRINDLFARKIDREIEEVVKVNQTDAAVVRSEMEEYVVTDAIRRSFLKVLEAFSETPNQPHERIGVWVSGFFGSGKSSFAKILGYVLEDRDVGGTSAQDLFRGQVNDPEIAALLKTIRTQVPAKAVIFDVSSESTVTDASERLTDIVYRVLLRELGYAQDRDLAELEIEFEKKGTLERFRQAVSSCYDGKSWDDVKHLAATARNMASRALHELDPKTYPAADTWAKTHPPVQVTAHLVAERAFELMARRGKGRALVFVVDEVGQYVARSNQKLLDLNGLVQSLGVAGRAHASKWKGQAWLIVTSQERLSEVVDNLEGQQVELARVRDRFPIEIDLAPSDIQEVTSERVLKKTPQGKGLLQQLFQANRGKLKEATRLTGRYARDLAEEEFTDLYPFLPYQVDLLIEVVSALRTQGTAMRHVGGAARTIIKLAQQALIHPKTRLCDEPPGRLVTLAHVYDLLEGYVANERRLDVANIERQYGPQGMETQVAKALALLAYKSGLERSEENLAGVLHPSVDTAPLGQQVAAALKTLEAAGKARRGQEGWELLSQVGRAWEDEKRSISPSQAQRVERLQDLLRPQVQGLSGYRHKDRRTFTSAVYLNAQTLGGPGNIPLRIRPVFDPEDRAAAEVSTRAASNEGTGTNEIHWLLPLADDTLSTIDDWYRSQEMVRRKDASGAAQGEQYRLLSDERRNSKQLEQKAERLIRRDLLAATSFFRGAATPAASLGESFEGSVEGALAEAVPVLYPQFDIAAKPMEEADVRMIIEAPSLNNLPTVFGGGPNGLDLVHRSGGSLEIHKQAPLLAEVLQFIETRASYNEEVTGKLLESRFSGMPYGWDPLAVHLAVATLFRGGQIEVYSGRRYTSHGEPGVKDIFLKTTPFRSAQFKPRQGGLDWQARADCARALEELFGVEVPIEEGAIATAVKTRIAPIAQRAQEVAVHIQATGLPGLEEVRDLSHRLTLLVQTPSTEETVISFHQQRDAIRSAVKRVEKVARLLNDDVRDAVRRASKAQRWQAELAQVGGGAKTSEAASQLDSLMGSLDLVEHVPLLRQLTVPIWSAYDARRQELGSDLERGVDEALGRLQADPNWDKASDEDQESLREPFLRWKARAGAPDASLPELDSGIRGLGAALASATVRLIQVTAPPPTAIEGETQPPAPRVARIKVSQFGRGGLRSKDDLDGALEELRTACIAALERGEIVFLE